MIEAPTPLPSSFEAALAELESIVASMEAGQAPLEESLRAFERGNRLLQHCHGLLGAAEERLRVLEDGELKSPLEPASDAAETAMESP